MAIEFSVTRTLPGKPERVFGALTDLDAASQWMPGYQRIEKLTEGSFAVGTEWRETRKMFGKDATEQFEVTALEPPRRIGLRVDGSKGTMGKGEFLFEYLLEPSGADTEVTMNGRIEGLGPIGGLLFKLLGGQFEKAVAKDLDALAAHLRAGEAGG